MLTQQSSTRISDFVAGDGRQKQSRYSQFPQRRFEYFDSRMTDNSDANLLSVQL